MLPVGPGARQFLPSQNLHLIAAPKCGNVHYGQLPHYELAIQKGRSRNLLGAVIPAAHWRAGILSLLWIMNEPSESFLSDISAINSIEAVPSILQVIYNVTGMGFAAVARVTEGRWVACSVLDRIAFGLKPGEELIIGTTICNEIRQSREGVVIDDVAED